MTRVSVFKPNHKYRLISDYHRGTYPLVYDAKAGDILIFEFKVVGGFAQFYKAKPDKDDIRRPVMMKAKEAFKLLEEV